MKFKKVLSLVMSAVFAVTLCGCNNNSPSDSSKPTVGSDDNSQSVSDNSEVQSTNESSESEPEKQERNDPINITSVKDLVAQMKVGWNLGNTLDALGGEGVDSETAWGNPVTTKPMIDTVAAAGFNVIRIPVTWGPHMDENYVVDSAWMDRVQEVVDYGIDNGMFVILNTHHEEWYMPTEENVEEDLKQLGELWKQIAERFKGYGEHLIFEGVNEPRLRGDGREWTGTKAAREIVNQYAETFVKTVRASGGNNAERVLMVSPYAASSSPDNMKALKMPENAGNVIVSVHAYLPYSFALDTNGTNVYDENNGEIPGLFKNLKEIFIDNDIPVVLTECGNMNKENTEDRVKCTTDFFTGAKEIGVPCVWWDNHSYRGNGENFGLLSRRDLTWFSPDVLDAIMNAVN
ncbi:MAG: glycoside hydrolase family 5 protein [Oscillospiraceae bacterium]|nr:glycoside hydrolase family 5 protein [Oscillospiraceae bacterium]